MSQNRGQYWRAFNNNFFEKHQGVLIWLLNKPIIKYWFRWVMCITSTDLPWNKTITEIGPNYYTFEDKEVIRSHEKYSKRIYHAFKAVWWTMHYIDEYILDKYIPRLSFGFAILTAYPDPNPETSTVDGDVTAVTNASWDTVHDDTTGSAFDESNADIDTAAGFLTTVYFIKRGIFLFNTSSIDDTHNISSGILSLYGISKENGDNDGDDFVVIVHSNPASNTALVAGDINNVGDATNNPTELSQRIDIGSITNSVYNDFILNSNGLANISKTSISKFGIREGHDVLDSPIVASGTTVNRVVVSSADNTGTSQDPKLTITHALPSTTGGLVKLAPNF